MGEYRLFRNEIELEEVEGRERQDELIERSENFQLKLLNKQLEVVSKLSDSILSLATSIAKQPPTVNINLYLDKDTDPKNIAEIIKCVSGIK